MVVDKDTGELAPDSSGHATNFALYSSNPEENKSTLEIPIMKLKLNFKMIDETACLSKKAEGEHGDENALPVHTGPKWDYAQSGADWATIYPECAVGQ